MGDGVEPSQLSARLQRNRESPPNSSVFFIVLAEPQVAVRRFAELLLLCYFRARFRWSRLVDLKGIKDSVPDRVPGATPRPQALTPLFASMVICENDKHIVGFSGELITPFNCVYLSMWSFLGNPY